MKKDIGALWLNESKTGNKYMSGSIIIGDTIHKIVVFKNTYKEKENQPDYKIYPSQPQGQPAPDNAAPDNFDDDSIPF